jgi:hypothetical protein
MSEQEAINRPEANKKPQKNKDSKNASANTETDFKLKTAKVREFSSHSILNNHWTWDSEGHARL